MSKVYLNGVLSRNDWLYMVFSGGGECWKLRPAFNCWFLHSLLESLLECNVYFFYDNWSRLIWGKLGGYFYGWLLLYSSTDDSSTNWSLLFSSLWNILIIISLTRWGFTYISVSQSMFSWGGEFTSRSHGLRFWSTITSNPKSTKNC